MPTKRKGLQKSKNKADSEKQGLGTKVACSPKDNHSLDNVKCHECGKFGHYRNQCPEKGRSSLVQGCEEGNHIRHKNKCFRCGKHGHYVKQCTENIISSPVQGCEVPKSFATTNLEGGNTTQIGAPEALPASPMPLSNRSRDSMKCYKCGKRGHYQKQCHRIKGVECGKRGHCQDQCDSVKCFECGERGHYQNQCRKKRRSSPTQAYEALLTVSTPNSEGGDMSAHRALATLPTLSKTLENHYLDHSMCHYCGKGEYFQNQCPDNKVSAPMQSDAVPPISSTTDLEGLSASELKPTVEKLGLTSNQSDLFGNSNTTSPNIAFDAPSPGRSASAVTDPKVCVQSDTLAFDSASRMDTLPCSVSTAAFSSQTTSSLLHACKSSIVSSMSGAGFEFMQQHSAGTIGYPSDHSGPFASSTAFGTTSSKSALFGSALTSSACDVQTTSSLCGSSSTLVFGNGYHTSAFKNSTRLAPAFSGTSVSEQQSTTTVGLNVRQSSPLASNAITSNTLLGMRSQYAFGIPSTSVFGQSNATVMDKAGSMPALFSSTATTMPMPALDFKSSLSYLFRAPNGPFCGSSNANRCIFVSGSQTTTGNQMAAPGNQAPTPENQTTPGNQTLVPGNQTTMPGSEKITSENQATTSECQMAAPGNQVTTPGSQTTTPERQTTPGWKTGIDDQQRRIETPNSSTQNTSGKSAFMLDKSLLKDKHCEELSREDYHGDKGYNQKQVQALGQARSNPVGVTNITSSFDQSPKCSAPKPPVVVTSEDGKGSGDTPYKATKTSVWWDIENCQVPRGSETYYIAQNISSALADAGYKGAVTISAYGDTHKIPNAVQQALSSTGIALNHVPAGVKDASDKKILVDMLFWAVDNPPPANYLLISGDRDFSNALHQLRLRRYNILLAHAPSVSQALVAAAEKVWQWSSLLSGGPPVQDLEPGARTSGASRSSFNGIKGHMAKRLKWRDQNARETQKAFGVPQSEEGCDTPSEELASFHIVSLPELNEITGRKRVPMTDLSHEIVCAKRPRDSLNSSEKMPLESMLHGKNPFNGQPFKVSQLFPPSNSAPSQNTTNNSFITQPYHQHIMFCPPHLQSVHNNSTTNHHENIKPDQLCNGYQVHSSEVHFHIGYIVSALAELKANKIAPTEENISNCIRYGMGKQSIDVKTGLDYACENNMLTRYNLENGTPFYVEKNEEFWECINVLNINDKHSEETWNTVRNYLSSAGGQLAISSTECRYHAATVLKRSCLQHMLLGDVLQLLNTVIKFRKWIIPSPSGWQPLTFTITILPLGNAKSET